MIEKNFAKNQNSLRSPRKSRYIEFLDFELEESEEFNAEAEKRRMKIEKFRENFREDTAGSILQMLGLGLAFVVISLANYYSSRNSIRGIQRILKVESTLLKLEIHMNYGFSVFYESVSLNNVDLKYKEENVMDFELGLIQQEKINLISELNKDTFDYFSDYTTQITNFLSTNLCQNYFKPIEQSNLNLV